jgi:hypothetical protein
MPLVIKNMCVYLNHIAKYQDQKVKHSEHGKKASPVTASELADNYQIKSINAKLLNLL